jgi:hypothetical protein
VAGGDVALTSTYGAGRLLIVELPLRNGAISMDCALGRAERRRQGSADCGYSRDGDRAAQIDLRSTFMTAPADYQVRWEADLR